MRDRPGNALSRFLSLTPALSLFLSHTHLPECPWGNSRVRAGKENQPVQIIILLPCLIDARYFGLVLMTAFTEFMSSCAARGNFSLFLFFSPTVCSLSSSFSPPPSYRPTTFLRIISHEIISASPFCLAAERHPDRPSPSFLG